MTTTTIDPDTRERLRRALTSPHLRLVAGLGAADTPGAGRACTIAEIMLVLTGTLTDGPHPCINDTIRRWVITTQDAMPAELRNEPAWRNAAVGIAGSAAPAAVEIRRAELIIDWMWTAFDDPDVLVVIPPVTRPIWDQMLADRAPATDIDITAVGYAGSATKEYAQAARVLSAPTARAAATRAAELAGHAVDMAAYMLDRGRNADAFWRRRDPAGMLARLIAEGTNQAAGQ